MVLGKIIKQYRQRLGLTQSDLAQKLFLSNKTISSWELNRTQPSLDFIIKLSQIFNCRVDCLLSDFNKKSNIQTQLKIRLNEIEYKNMLKFFEKNAHFLNQCNHHDVYYQPKHRKFLSNDNINEWLRIGERGNRNILTYKKFHNFYCDEYEVEIYDSNNLNIIFEILGLEQICVVNKKRNSFLYMDKYEVYLDHVQNLGYFIEIKIKKYDMEIIEEYNELLKLTNNLNIDLKKVETKRSAEQIIEKNNK